jgi:predicted transcriptional regulator of viral defense system
MLASSKTGKVYNALLLRFGRIVTSDDVKKVAADFKMDPRSALVSLKRDGILEPVLFQGIYYVRNREERDLHTIQEDPLRIMARACDVKLGKDWYFGLATALKLAGVWEQQSLTTITIITKKRILRRKVFFADYAVEFKVLSIPSFQSNLRVNEGMRYSDPVRTLLDFAYLSARSGELGEYPRNVVAAILKTGRRDLIDQAEKSLDDYPQLYRVFLDRLLSELKRSEIRSNSR